MQQRKYMNGNSKLNFELFSCKVNSQWFTCFCIIYFQNIYIMDEIFEETGRIDPEKLYNGCRNSDPDAWNHLNRIVSKIIYQNYSSKNPADIEDVTQNTVTHLFIYLCVKNKVLKEPGAFLSVIYKTIKHKFIDNYRKNKRYPKISLDDPEHPIMLRDQITEHNPIMPNTHLPSHVSTEIYDDPHVFYMISFIKDKMLECFDLLGFKCQRALKSYFRYRIDTGGTLKDYAEKCGENINKLASECNRCLKHLHEKIIKRFGAFHLSDDPKIRDLLMNQFLESLENIETNHNETAD
ncbi:MAG: hypothetical protein A2161_19025 [Candidatus Schekmanbacteria bacterium RBG_13_48_7]|uniref:Uncharacterized protein n=1 Tax=Candidatus Schekmanbacteria bacterium RBG_13_48_7 TaxID=1817878 RepID=A0A1F7RQK1_9BACT|nr:MAG: hypothetical protein A2161_19025 [Candidatus Schekmanbacteria bacterium RBG_13_48_7]